MLVFTLLSTLSNAEASPSKGFRLGVCAGASSHCPLAQVKLGYNHDQVAFNVGVGLFSLSATGQYYLTSPEQNTRQFISASWTPLAFPGVAIGFDGSVGLYMMSGFGAAYGADFHLFEKRWLVLTPKVGIDLNTTAEGDATDIKSVISPSLSLDMSFAF